MNDANTNISELPSIRFSLRMCLFRRFWTPTKRHFYVPQLSVGLWYGHRLSLVHLCWRSRWDRSDHFWNISTSGSGERRIVIDYIINYRNWISFVGFLQMSWFCQTLFGLGTTRRQRRFKLATSIVWHLKPLLTHFFLQGSRAYLRVPLWLLQKP